jgi:2-succinyl-6-hydroxy-2,4-cyclohexadiene-1-carboxylate synthase
VDVRGEGPPLLLLHGFTGSGAAWGERILAGLTRSWRVILPDLPGHGESDPPPAASYGIPELVQDLAQLLGELGLKNAHWIGYSMGGRIALAAAVLAPERVDRLVLEGSSPGLEDAGERRARKDADAALAESITTTGVERFMDEWLAQPLFATQRALPASVLAAERQRRLKNRPDALAAALRAFSVGGQPSFWDRLDEVAAPTLLLTGEEDVKFTDTARRMSERMPKATHAIVPGAGHAVHLERPDVWLEAVRGALHG